LSGIKAPSNSIKERVDFEASACCTNIGIKRDELLILNIALLQIWFQISYRQNSGGEIVKIPPRNAEAHTEKDRRRSEVVELQTEKFYKQLLKYKIIATEKA
jgi:hypothetical protein